MYYFDILEILKKDPRKEFRPFDIFLKISNDRPANLINVQKVLRKMSLRHPNVYVIRKMANVGNGKRPQIYYYYVPS